MKILTTLILAILLTSCSSWPEYEGYANREPSSSSTRIYDRDGNYIGHIDESQKRIYDRDGNFIGMISK